jgi:hypothetical protein
MRRAVPPLPRTPSWRRAQLKHRDCTINYIHHILSDCAMWQLLRRKCDLGSVTGERY